MSFYKYSKRLYAFLKELFEAFSDDNCFTISAAIAYYAALSLAPMLLIVIVIAGMVLSKETVSNEIYAQTVVLIGEEAAALVLDLLKKSSGSIQNASLRVTIISGVTILIGATTVFGVLHESFNAIWKVDSRQKNNFARFFQRRALGLGILIVIGALLVTFLLAQTILSVFYDIIAKMVRELPAYVNVAVNSSIFLSVLLLWFILIFKTCSDAKISWGLSFKGSIFTVALLLVGHWLISFYMSESNLGSIYGAAGSLVIILTWIYYSAAIVLLGAEFIKTYAKWTKEPLTDNS